jgi:hypothetical protein
MPRPVVSRKYRRPSVPGGSSRPSSSTTKPSNGGTARPTEPGWASQSVELIEHTVPDSVPPYDSDSTGPHQSIIARLTSTGQVPPVWATCRSDDTS